MLLIGAIVYGKTATNSRTCPPSTYNLLNLPETVTSGNTQTATYHWLADGTKYQVEDASGNGVIYAGDLTYAVTVSGGTPTYALESAEASVDGTARFLKNGTAMTPYYTIRDHLGSVRTIVNASGTVVERNDYYPFGSRTTFGASYPTLSINRQKFSGKEDQGTIGSSTLPYLDFGARMYDAKLVRWNTYDPMAEKYYGINPYVYCNGDPVNLVDPDGSIVKPKSQREVEMIRNTLPQKARQYVQLTKEGYIDGKTLSKYKGKSQNYSSLTELVESNYIVFVSLSDSFSFLDKNGNAGIHTMSFFPFDTNHPEDRDIGFQSVSGVTTGESGFLGKVLFPDKEGDENSTTSNIEIYVNKSLSTVGSAEIFSHEAYGHALRYIRTGGDHQKASHQIKGTFDENNELKRMIIESRRETVKNLTK